MKAMNAMNAMKAMKGVGKRSALRYGPTQSGDYYVSRTLTFLTSAVQVTDSRYLRSAVNRRGLRFHALPLANGVAPQL